MNDNNSDKCDRILIVDDSVQNVQLLEAYLISAGYDIECAYSGKDALNSIMGNSSPPPDLVILDVMMPGMSGFEVCEQIKDDPETMRVPVMLLTALQDIEDKVKGYEAGADEFLSKPVDKLELLIRVKSMLRTKHLNEDLESARNVIYTLALAIEANDPYTRGHSERVAEIGVRIARELSLSESQQETIRNAGILHDIGKIGISENILQKPGPLTEDELEEVQDHPEIGEKICAPLRSTNKILTVIRHHQERHDGDGYPDGLRGDSIPVEARIIAVADAYDAMTSPRPYRPPMAMRDVLETLKRESGRQWDPRVIEAFLALMEKGEIFSKSPS